MGDPDQRDRQTEGRDGGGDELTRQAAGLAASQYLPKLLKDFDGFKDAGPVRVCLCADMCPPKVVLTFSMARGGSTKSKKFVALPP